MKFGQILKEVAWLLLTEHSVSYRRIQSDFDLDQDALEAVRREFVQNKRWAVDSNGEYLVLVGAVSSPTASPGVSSQAPLEVLTPLAPLTSHRSLNPPDSLPGPKQFIDASPVDPVRESANAERRQLTVMFCDLVGSTDLSGRVDAENLRDVVRAYQESAAQVIKHYEGHIAQYLGDGLLVYFGYPLAHEDDARRAVHVALGIVEGLTDLNRRLQIEHGVQLAVRLGIHTGLVVVGEMGGGGRHEQLALGETPNVAARLEALAGSNQIVISSRTRELAGDGFVYEDLGECELKGVDEPFRTWGVLGLREEIVEQDNIETGPAQPALVGRDEEAGLLRRAWQSTRDEGRGRVVTISGEAGIGKSVLVDGLQAEVQAAGSPVITLRCSPYHANSAMYPLIEHFKQVAGWRADDGPEARIGKLEAMLERYSQHLNETVPLFASLLSLALPEERYAPLAMTAQQQKRETQHAIIAVLLEAAEREPVLELWEDLHWADPSTLELLGLLIEQAPTASLLIVLTARPEFAAPWSARSNVTPITLIPLERAHAEALVARLAGMKPLPAEVRNHVVTKADGVPLYVEELTKTILASNILNDAGAHYELNGPLSSLEIPSTLQESLMARLDRLPQVRELAQLGSVLGREFAYEMLSGLSNAGDALLQKGLEKLVEDELLYQRGRPPRARYIFKHALLRDAAYASLLRRTRAQYHLQVAELLEASFPETTAAHPELVAHHLSEAGEAVRAIAYLQKAGEQSLRASANAEAIVHLSSGLKLATALPENTERDRRELELLMVIGPALVSVKGYGAPEVVAAYRRALDLSEAVGDAKNQIAALDGLWYVSYFKDHLDAARKLAEQLAEVAERTKHAEPELSAYGQIAAHRSLGYTLFMLGMPKDALPHYKSAIHLYNPAVHNVQANRYGGTDPGVGSLTLTAMALFALGFPDQARDSCTRGLTLARELAHPFTEAWALTSMAIIHQFRREPEDVLRHAGTAASISDERGMPQFFAWASMVLAWASFETGTGRVESITEFRRHFDSSQVTTDYMLTPYWRALLAGMCGGADQHQLAVELIDDALDSVARRGERVWEAELHRLKGELLLKSHPANDAEIVATVQSHYEKALRTAQAQQAKSWELRAAISLARLWQQHGRHDEAYAVLTPVYSWFTEGFDTRDLKRARGLLDELEATNS